MQTTVGATDTLHLTNTLDINHRKLSQEKLSQNNTTANHQYRNENDNNTERLPTSRSCTCRKLLSRQTQIRRTCTCGHNNNNQKTQSSDNTKPKQYLENSNSRTEEYHRQYCKNIHSSPYPRLSLDTPYGDNNHIRQQKNPKMLDDGLNDRKHHYNNGDYSNHENNDGSNNSGDENDGHRGSQDEFNFEDIDLEASLYPEKVFYCLHRESRWRHWAIRMTQSPYPFHIKITEMKYYRDMVLCQLTYEVCQ